MLCIYIYVFICVVERTGTISNKYSASFAPGRVSAALYTGWLLAHLPGHRTPPGLLNPSATGQAILPTSGSIGHLNDSVSAVSETFQCGVAMATGRGGPWQQAASRGNTGQLQLQLRDASASAARHGPRCRDGQWVCPAAVWSWFVWPLLGWELCLWPFPKRQFLEVPL